MIEGLFIDLHGRIFFHTMERKHRTYNLARFERLMEMHPSPTFKLDEMIPGPVQEVYEYKGDAGPYAVYAQVR